MKRVIAGILIGVCLFSKPVLAMESQTNELTSSETQLLLKVAQAEAGNQGPDGIWLVMSCIVNRIGKAEFPNNLEAVVYQPYQFTTDFGSEISPDAYDALDRIERGDVAPQIVAFETSSSNVLEKYYNMAFSYRDHKFYTLGK